MAVLQPHTVLLLRRPHLRQIAIQSIWRSLDLPGPFFAMPSFLQSVNSSKI